MLCLTLMPQELLAQPVRSTGAQHSRRRKNPDLAGHKHQRHRRLDEASDASCCCDSALGFEMRVGADSPAGASAAARALTSALPGIVVAGQPGTCLASAIVSGRRSPPLGPELMNCMMKLVMPWAQAEDVMRLWQD